MGKGATDIESGCETIEITPVINKKLATAFAGIAAGFLGLCAAYVPYCRDAESPRQALQGAGLAGFGVANVIGLLNNIPKLCGKGSVFGDAGEKISQKISPTLIAGACALFAADTGVSMGESEGANWQQLVTMASSGALFGAAGAMLKKYPNLSLGLTALGAAGLAAPAAANVEAVMQSGSEEEKNITLGIIGSCAVIAASAGAAMWCGRETAQQKPADALQR